jgi:diguanylate cyclase (GGDEF)-like protein
VEHIVGRIRSAEGLPSPPGVALAVLRLVRNDDCGVDELLGVIESDPALTARILTVVNSSLYGLANKITSLRQAVVALGLRAVKVMALSFALVDAVRGWESHDGAFDYRAYWRRSITTAVGARLLCKAARSRLAEEAFVGGLLADLGIMAAWQCAREWYEPVLAKHRAGTGSLVQLEKQYFGATHAVLGRALLSVWGLPDELCEVAGAHHGEGLEELAGRTGELARCVHCAAQLADVLCHETPPEQWPAIRQECVQRLAISPRDMDALLAQLDARVRETAALLHVELSDALEAAVLQGNAAMQLARLSVQAERARASAERREKEAVVRACELESLNERTRESAVTDWLTQVANRAAFEQRLAALLRYCQTRGAPLALVLLDIDHFKRINDERGHQGGDEALRQVAGRLRQVVRQEGFVARYGGEEFALILAEATREQACHLAEEIRRVIEACPVILDGHETHITASLGLAYRGSRELDNLCPRELIDAADRALYAAKRNGRNQRAGELTLGTRLREPRDQRSVETVVALASRPCFHRRDAGATSACEAPWNPARWWRS